MHADVTDSPPLRPRLGLPSLHDRIHPRLHPASVLYKKASPPHDQVGTRLHYRQDLRQLLQLLGLALQVETSRKALG